MKTIVIALALGFALGAGAQEKQEKSAAKAVANKKLASQKSEPNALPKDAVEIEPGVYRWKDAQGKTWIIRRSPFGLLKSEERQTNEPAGEDDASLALKVLEEGDQLRFERRTPFGVTRWTKKKTELDELERRAWEREQKGREAGRPKE